MKHQPLSIQHNEAGFSFIEIIVLFVFIAVLVATVAHTFAGIKARTRDNIRTASLRSLQVNIESFYAQNMYYPSLADMNRPSWRAANMQRVSTKSFQDPSWTKNNRACSRNNQPILLSTSQNGCYGYHPTNNGISCEAAATTCDDYTLTANLEQGGIYTKTQLD